MKKALKIVPYVIIGVLIGSTLYYRGLWYNLRLSMMQVDSFSFANHRTMDLCEEGIKNREIAKAVSLIDSVHYLILERSGGIDEESGASIRFDNFEYPDLVLMNYGFKQVLRNTLIKVKETSSNGNEKKRVDSMLRFLCGSESEDNSVTEISVRLMSAKLVLLEMDFKHRTNQF